MVGLSVFRPALQLLPRRPQEILNLLLFMVVAVVTSHLANSAKQQTTIARKREQEMSDLYAFSRRLAAAPSAADIFVAIQDHLANLVQRKVVLFGAADAGDDRATCPSACAPRSARVEQDRRRRRTVDDGAGNIWLVRRVSPKTPDFGVIAIDLGSVPGEALAEFRQRVDDVLSDAAATLERLDVARALNEAKMRSETELLREALIGSVSHELRTPLASILGAATVLSQRAGDRRSDERLHVARRRGARRGRAAQQRHPEPARCHHASAAQQVQAEAAMDRAGRHRQFRDRAPPAPACRPQRLARSRFESAVHPCRPGPGRAGVGADRRQRREIFARCRLADHGHRAPSANWPATVVLAVHDSGAGLTAEEKRQVGERFFRGARHAATTSGSGLGLWIANAFVTANGGKIEVESEGADHGTTVSIHLPFAEDARQREVGPDD